MRCRSYRGKTSKPKHVVWDKRLCTQQWTCFQSLFFSSKGFSNTVSWTFVANCLIGLKVKKIFCSMGKLCINRENLFVPLLFSTQISVCQNEKMNKTVCLKYCLVGFYQASVFLFIPVRLLGPFRAAANHKHTFHHWAMHLFLPLGTPCVMYILHDELDNHIFSVWILVSRHENSARMNGAVVTLKLNFIK